jgi:glycogen debranching enzyme
VADSWGRQPLLNDAVLCVWAPAVAISGPDGQVRGHGADGFYLHDRRLLGTLLLTLDGTEPEPVDHHRLGPARARFVAVHRDPEDATQDPVVVVERLRDAARGSETITVHNHGSEMRYPRVSVALDCDLAGVSLVKGGLRPQPLAVETEADALSWSSAADGTRVTVRVPAESGATVEAGTLTWNPRLEPGSRWSVTLEVGVKEPDHNHPVRPRPAEPPPWRPPGGEPADERLGRLLRQSLGDLDALRLADPLCPPGGPRDQFVAAGSPWYLTLFGRDSIWAARMMLPLGTGLAAGTLRTLARRQGRRDDDAREEAPGKILHELRRGESAHWGDLVLPPCYYGSVDATPLFTILLVEAWRAGLAAETVEELRPAAERAMEWVAAQAGPDGFVGYDRRHGSGLIHRGWKDSVDAILFADGHAAEAPIALCEVQGYAYQAATGLADLLASSGRARDAARWRDWAGRLAQRFREAFWIRDGDGRYVAIALDGTARPVTGLASNMGHLLGTGILDPAECAAVADRLVSAELDSGWGLRTRGSDCARFNPLSYHGGSVWVHDTAIAVAGLAATGHHAQARRLADGLLDAAHAFGYRLPELYGGDRRTADRPAPLPYPAACRPQAWAAAAAVMLLSALEPAAGA